MKYEWRKKAKEMKSKPPKNSILIDKDDYEFSLFRAEEQGKASVYEEIKTARRCLIHCTYGRLPEACETTCNNLGCPLNKHWSKKSSPASRKGCSKCGNPDPRVISGEKYCSCEFEEDEVPEINPLGCGIIFENPNANIKREFIKESKTKTCGQ